MKTNIGLFWLLGGFFLASAIAYVLWTIIEYGAPEFVGTVGITLGAVLAAFIAFYLGLVHRAQGGELAEDRDDANIEDGDSEVGHYSPWSWWPIVLAGSLATTFLGLAVGAWIVFIGVPLVVIALVGWVYEYYRGNFAR
ncbi:MAG: cytochrome c oxidase subunit 4 [Microbacterium sp.]|nr:cytochrome c oxidase subunit 4 [Microbacterium sp.]